MRVQVLVDCFQCTSGGQQPPGQQDLQPGFMGAGAQAKDGEDEGHAVQNRQAPHRLQVALLDPRQHCVHKHPAG